ncbi:uncharacterized protein LOC128954422 [Oppia nitens]|uniref:uncharacterized protein LOC128954422 n=1 Tax=Oppia nitens TaxID=1686743 RepID=UPI0023DA2FDF|nr:uncharacterized protein LOC128954422 [Oppia nitens]
MRDSFDRFGDDLVELLLSSMKTTIEDKFKLQLVSKQWQRLIFNGQTDIQIDLYYHNYSQTVKLFAAIILKCPNIKTLAISYHYYNMVSQNNRIDSLLVKLCRYLRHLSLQSKCMESLIIDRLLAAFGRQLKTLKLNEFIVDNHRVMINYVIQYCPQLNKLVINDRNINNFIDFRHYFTDDTGVNCILSTIKLKSITFELSTECQSLFDKFAANYANQLTSLDIVINFHNKTVIPLFVKSLTQFCQLRRLRLKCILFYDILIDNLIINGFSGWCLKLKSLSIVANFQTISDYQCIQLMDSLGKDLKQLKRLAIDCHVLTKYGKIPKLTSNSLIQMKQLTHLSLNLEKIYFCDQFFHNIVKHLPRLQLIDITNADITRRSLQSLSRLRKLKSVRIASCRNRVIADQLIIDDLITAKSMVTNVCITYITKLIRLLSGVNYQ